MALRQKHKIRKIYFTYAIFGESRIALVATSGYELCEPLKEFSTKLKDNHQLWTNLQTQQSILPDNCIVAQRYDEVSTDCEHKATNDEYIESIGHQHQLHTFCNKCLQNSIVCQFIKNVITGKYQFTKMPSLNSVTLVAST
jgi:hypothetical protein